MSKLGETVNRILENLRQAKLRNDQTAKSYAYAELYNTTYESLRIVARTYLNNRNEDQACVTDAYEKAYQYIHSLSQDKDGYNWLCKIVQTCAFDINKTYAPYVALDEIAQTVADPVSIDEYIQKRELREAIKQLSEEEQKLIQYHFYADLSMEQTAKKMHVVKGTVFYRLKNVIEKLRQIFGDF